MSAPDDAGLDRAVSTGSPTAPRSGAVEPAHERLTSLLESLSQSGIPGQGHAVATPGDALPSGAEDGDARARRRSQQRRDAERRHMTALDGLIRSLDVVAFAEISILYYLDNSLARLLLRAIPHFLFFRPKPATVPGLIVHFPHVTHLVLVNTICALLHVFLAAPRGSEASRGYLHGGLLIDFVGERGPIAKYRLLLADLMVLVVQVVQLAVVRERERLDALARIREGKRARAATPATDGAPDTQGIAGAEVGTDPFDASSTVPAAVTTATQDYDAEEMGIRREWQAGIGAGTDDEDEDGDDSGHDEAAWLVSEDPLANATQRSIDRGEEARVAAPRRREREENEDDHDNDNDFDEEHSAIRQLRHRQHPLDKFYAGQFLVADLSLWSTLREEWKGSHG